MFRWEGKVLSFLETILKNHFLPKKETYPLITNEMEIAIKNLKEQILQAVTEENMVKWNYGLKEENSLGTNTTNQPERVKMPPSDTSDSPSLKNIFDPPLPTEKPSVSPTPQSHTTNQNEVIQKLDEKIEQLEASLFHYRQALIHAVGHVDEDFKLVWGILIDDARSMLKSSTS